MGDVERQGQGAVQPDPTEAEDLDAVAGFFGLPTEGEVMQKLTGLDEATLRAITSGSITASHRREHSGVLGRLARSSEEALGQIFDDGPVHFSASMLRWLEERQVDTSMGRVKAIDALSDPLLAQEVLRDVEGFGHE